MCNGFLIYAYEQRKSFHIDIMFHLQRNIVKFDAYSSVELVYFFIKYNRCINKMNFARKLHYANLLSSNEKCSIIINNLKICRLVQEISNITINEGVKALHYKKRKDSQCTFLHTFVDKSVFLRSRCMRTRMHNFFRVLGVVHHYHHLRL